MWDDDTDMNTVCLQTRGWDLGDDDLEYLVKVFLCGGSLTDLDLSGITYIFLKFGSRHLLIKFLFTILIMILFTSLDNKISSVECLLLLPNLCRLNIANNLITSIHYAFGKLEEIVFNGWCFVEIIVLPSVTAYPREPFG